MSARRGAGRAMGARPRVRPPRAANFNLNRNPLQEMTYQLAMLTAELGNLRDVMQSLSNTIYANSTILEQLIQNNEEVIDEFNNME